MSRIAFVTTCKNRLQHLQQTLPLWVAEGPDEIVVVDYGCPQGTGDWVEANWPQVKVLRVTDDPGFCLSRARNLGATATDADWLCFIDADLLVRPGWVAWMRANLCAGHLFRAGEIEDRRQPETWGTALVERSVWCSVGGYDELFTGWGGEDADLYDRIQLAGVGQRDYPPEYVEAISHDDATRFTYSVRKTKDDNRRFQNFYRFAKYVWMTVAGVQGDLPRAQREQLRAMVAAAFHAAEADPRGLAPSMSFEIDTPGAWVPAGRRDGARCRCTMRIELPQRFRRMRKRAARWWRVLRILAGGRRDSRPAPTLFTLDGALVQPALAAVEQSGAADHVQVEARTLLYSRPSYQPVHISCRYDLPPVAPAAEQSPGSGA